MKLLSGIGLLCLFLFLSATAIGQPVLGFQTVTTGLSNPVDVVDPGDNRLYIVQQGGLIRLWNGSSLSTFLDVSGLITNPAGSEQGLLSIAFHPQYASNRYFFIWYTGVNGILTLARYQRDASNADLADPATAQVLFTQAKPGTPAFTNHNGSKLNFGPDGYLYIGTGDGGSAGDPNNNAQNGNSYLGKMLRIDVNGFATAAPFYSIPPSNPYTSGSDGILDEIYCFGLRNPWRWSFDRNTQDVWIGDVGQGTWEEVNYIPAGTLAGKNFGWKCYEGAHPYSGASCTIAGVTDPVFEYGHNSTTGGFSITGGYVYRGSEFAALQGYYITADYVSGNCWLVRPNGSGGWINYLQTGLPSNISSFGEGSNGTLYALKRNTGTLYKVIVTAVLPVNITEFRGTAYRHYNRINWKADLESPGVRYRILYSTDGSRFREVGTVPGGQPIGSRYQFDHSTEANNIHFYRLAIDEADGRTAYSAVIRLENNTTGIEVYPTVCSDGNIRVRSAESLLHCDVHNAAGIRVARIAIPGWQNGVLALPALPKGLYFLRFQSTQSVFTESIVLP